MKYQSIYELNKVQQYIMQMRPILRRKALFSDGTADYRSPVEPKENEKVTIRFRTFKNNVDVVWLCSEGKKYMMTKAQSTETFDYYAVEIQLGTEPFCYYFEVVSGVLLCRYDRYGVTEDVREQYFFRIVPGFSTPEWAKGAVMYQIMVDRFYNGDMSNDVLDREYFYIKTLSARVPADQWEKAPESFGVREFYGGDIEGVWKKLDYLAKLGVEVIYFNPIFVSPSSHKYDIQDYDHIDPHFGKIIDDEGELLTEGDSDNRKATRFQSRVTSQRNLEASNAFFADFVKEVHKRGMKVILDGVFNHCGSFNKWMDRERIYENAPGYEKGAYVAQDSPYHNYFHFHDNHKWPYNGSYDGWWGHDTLPKLNYENSQQLEDYILYIARKWVAEPYHVDGWRLDVAADLGRSPEYNHYFWQEFRKAVKEANPDAIILAEHYGNTRDWLQGNEWDTVMNYDAFMEPVTWFLTGMEKHSDDFREDLLGNADSFWGAMVHHSSSFAMPSWQVAMNELSNHDHSRFLTRTNHKVGRTGSLGPHAAEQDINKGVFREAVVMQMTWPGAPTIYYGDEAGLCGFTDPDNRRTYPWGREDQELIAFHRDMIRLRRENDELRTGSIMQMEGDYNFLAYGRFHRRGQCLILINNNDHPITRKLMVWVLGTPKHGKMRTLIQTGREGYSLGGPEYELTAGRITVEIPGTCAMVLKYFEE